MLFMMELVRVSVLALPYNISILAQIILQFIINNHQQVTYLFR
jgi:hypothetical protein